MSGLLSSIFGSNDNDEDGLDALLDLLDQRQTTLALEAVYGRPRLDRQGEPTAVFPATIYHEGERYGTVQKEFVVPDDGLADNIAPLTTFLARCHGIPESDVTIDHIVAVEGIEARAELTPFGEIEVYEDA